jgi:class 3 adenylate cyclase
MQGNYLVAVCDILGFSALVQEHDLHSVVEDALGWFRKALGHSIHGGEFPPTPPAMRALANHEQVGVAWFSDTVLLYTKHDTDAAVADLVTTVASLLFETILQGSTKVRAGVAYGEAFMDQDSSLYAGKPIIEAYCLEKNQEWAGAALAASACERVARCGPEGAPARWYLVPWEVPTKGGPLSTLAVNWSRGVHAREWRMMWSSTSELPPMDAKRGKREKFLNTKRFHEAHSQDCMAHETHETPVSDG